MWSHILVEGLTSSLELFVRAVRSGLGLLVDGVFLVIGSVFFLKEVKND